MSYDPNMPQHGAPTGAPDPALVEKLRDKANRIMTLSIISFIIGGPLLSVPAWIWSNKLLAEARNAGVSTQDVSKAVTGRYISMANVAVAAFIVVFYVVSFLTVSLMGGPTY